MPNNKLNIKFWKNRLNIRKPVCIGFVKKIDNELPSVVTTDRAVTTVLDDAIRIQIHKAYAKEEVLVTELLNVKFATAYRMIQNLKVHPSIRNLFFDSLDDLVSRMGDLIVAVVRGKEE